MIAVLFMILWTGSYSFGWAHSFPRMSSIHWYAHEMLYGYAMAVIAGFLLTAVCNWTGQPALQRTGLMLPFLLWLAARLASMLDLAVSPWLMLLCDLGFWILLSVAVMKPILKVRQWRQSGILAKLLLLVSKTSPFMRESWVGLKTAFVGGFTEDCISSSDWY